MVTKKKDGTVLIPGDWQNWREHLKLFLTILEILQTPNIRDIFNSIAEI